MAGLLMAGRCAACEVVGNLDKRIAATRRDHPGKPRPRLAVAQTDRGRVSHHE
jgi:hypothetical protein